MRSRQLAQQAQQRRRVLEQRGKQEAARAGRQHPARVVKPLLKAVVRAAADADDDWRDSLSEEEREAHIKSLIERLDGAKR